jgi:hypothetical protein
MANCRILWTSTTAAVTQSARNPSAGKYQLHALGAVALVRWIAGACGVAASVADAPAVHMNDHRAELMI